jgi:hypothetical protein
VWVRAVRLQLRGACWKLRILNNRPSESLGSCGFARSVAVACCLLRVHNMWREGPLEADPEMELCSINQTAMIEAHNLWPEGPLLFRPQLGDPTRSGRGVAMTACLEGYLTDCFVNPSKPFCRSGFVLTCGKHLYGYRLIKCLSAGLGSSWSRTSLRHSAGLCKYVISQKGLK